MKTLTKQKGGREQHAGGPKVWAALAKQKSGREQSPSGRKLWGPLGKKKGSREASASGRKLWGPLGKQKASPEESASARKVWAAPLIAVSLLIVGAAQRDIQRRDEAEVRGRKLLWRLASLNALGALAYFLFGRREAATKAAE